MTTQEFEQAKREFAVKWRRDLALNEGIVSMLSDLTALIESLLPSEEEKKKWLKGHGYYGSCTEEYYEGLEEGIEWLRSRLLAAIDAKDDARGVVIIPPHTA